MGADNLHYALTSVQSLDPNAPLTKLLREQVDNLSDEQKEC